MNEMSKNLCFRKRNRNVSESSESENDRKRRRKRKKRSYWMESESGDTDENTSFKERSAPADKIIPLCKCDVTARRLLSRTEANPNRWFYRCSMNECDTFVWEDNLRTVLTLKGLRCYCGQPSTQRSRKKELVWVCANPDTRTACKWMRNCEDDSPTNLRRPNSSSTDNNPGDLEFLVSGPDRSKIQKLFKIPFNTPLERKLTGDTLNYDDLEVELAWKVVNQVSLRRYSNHDRTAYKERHKSIKFSPDYEQSVRKLLCHRPLNRNVNEVLLIHGTKAENVYSILFEGLDTALARCGMYGRGIYFSDEGAKINQYSSVDAKDERKSKGHRLQKLHHKLYGGLAQHPGDVFYAFLCRVALGENVVIKKNSNIPFKNKNQDSLEAGKHSLQVVRSGRQLHREFVAFDSADVYIEYIVAYKRRRSYCDCGVEGTVRHVAKRTINYDRPFFFCGNDPKKCDVRLMFPLCDCGVTAEVVYRDEMLTQFKCGRRNSKCRFRKEERNTHTI